MSNERQLSECVLFLLAGALVLLSGCEARTDLKRYIPFSIPAGDLVYEASVFDRCVVAVYRLNKALKLQERGFNPVNGEPVRAFARIYEDWQRTPMYPKIPPSIRSTRISDSLHCLKNDRTIFSVYERYDARDEGGLFTFSRKGASSGGDDLVLLLPKEGLVVVAIDG